MNECALALCGEGFLSVGTLGYVAVVLTLLVQPGQIVTVLRSVRRPEVLAGVSLVTPSLICATSLLWGSYGWRSGAYPLVATAAFDLVIQVAIVSGLVAGGRARAWRLAAMVSVPVAGGVVALSLPVVVLGPVAAAVSASMYLPQAARLVSVARTRAVDGFGWWPSVMVIVANVAWVGYGVGLGDVWVWLPAVLHVSAGVILVVVKVDWFFSGPVPPP